MRSSSTLNITSRTTIINKIRQINEATFFDTAMDVFRYQSTYNQLYVEFLALLSHRSVNIKHLKAIPFLPIQFFKNYAIKSGKWSEQAVFRSSGTTGASKSRHFVRDLEWYQENARKAFEDQYGSIKNLCILGLLPSYLERDDASLVYMVKDFIDQSKYPQSGFFLNDLDELASTIVNCQQKEIPIVLIGVSFALLDFAEKYNLDLRDCIIMETGGMKGKRKEIIRKELHHKLELALSVPKVHSEYGMTELLSQAYSKGNGLFYPPATMKVFTREITDPFTLQFTGKTGALNIIDLANLDTISFIATDDIARVYKDGSFEILGRMDNSDIRGCNLMVH